MPQFEHAQWFAAGGDPNSFVICDSLDPKKTKVQVSCIDPRVSGGRRWVLSEDNIGEVIGAAPYQVAPVPYLVRPCPRLPVLVAGENRDRDENIYRLLIIDTLTGTILRCFALDWPTMMPVVSRDGQLLVYVDTSTTQQMFKLMSLEDGRLLGEFDALPNHGYVYPFAFTDDSRLLAADDNAIWAFDISKGWSAKRIFHLADPTAGD